MFLHSGASLHGHEYSNRPSPNNPHTAPRRILLRSALGTPNTNSPRSITPASDTESRARAPLPPSRRLSLSDPPATPSPRPCSIRNHRPTSEYIPRKELVVRFEEPLTEDEQEKAPAVAELPSEDDASYSLSELSDHSSGTVRRKRRRRAPRQSTNYLLAYPPPRLRTKQRRLIQIRPKLLLQLQQLSADKRPTPAIDVLPSGPLAGTVILPRLARRFPRILGVKGELGLHDLIVVKSEDYGADDSDDSDEESLDKRELIAVISPLSQAREGQQREPAGEAEIVLGDGSVWIASATPNGSYDFTHTDAAGHTTTARWVKRSVSTSSEVSATATPDYKFTFSVLDPLSRRHPIMATLTPASLEVLDHYTTVSQSCGRYPPSRPFSTDLGSPGEWRTAPASSPATRTSHAVDDATRTLISISSVWVSLRHGQGWPITSVTRPANARSATTSDRVRSATYPITTTPEPEHTPSICPKPLSKRQTACPVKGATPSPPLPTVPRRAMSSGAAFMQRRQEKLHPESPSPEPSNSDIEEVRDLKYADVPIKKAGIYRRLREWGHRLTTRKQTGS